MSREDRRMPSPENLRVYFNGYIEAIAKHQVPGQDNEAAKAACVYEENDPTEGVNRHYCVDYKFRTSHGDSLYIRFQHAGHMPANNIDWNTSRGHVSYYMNGQQGLMFMYSDGGSAWFNSVPSGSTESVYAPVPTMHNVEVRTHMMRASGGWLDEFLERTPEEYSANVRKKVAMAIDRFNAGQTLPPEQCIDWNDAEAQFNRDGARHFPEYLQTYLLLELSKATGIMSFNDWMKAQDTTDESSSEDTN